MQGSDLWGSTEIKVMEDHAGLIRMLLSRYLMTCVITASQQTSAKGVQSADPTSAVLFYAIKTSKARLP